MTVAKFFRTISPVKHLQFIVSPSLSLVIIRMRLPLVGKEASEAPLTASAALTGRDASFLMCGILSYLLAPLRPLTTEDKDELPWVGNISDHFRIMLKYPIER